MWFDASRTRVLPSVHQEAVDAELAKRANKEEISALEKQQRQKPLQRMVPEMDIAGIVEAGVFSYLQLSLSAEHSG